MKKLLTILLILISHLTFGQVKSVIINSETKNKVPYVNIWFENEDIGTTSNERGEFELKITGSKTILFSAVGFKSKRINSDSIGNILELKPQVTELGEVIIRSEKLSQELVIGAFNKSKINHYFGCGEAGPPWIKATYFEYKEEYNTTPFLKKIKLLTNSEVKDSKFNIRLYNVNETGEPGDYMYNENIIGIAKRGRRVTEIDLSNLHLEFPKEGFFVAMEWFIIEQNKYEYKYVMEGSKKKLDGISYEPAIGTVSQESIENNWTFFQGKWKKSDNNLENRTNKFGRLAIELTLTN